MEYPKDILSVLTSAGPLLGSPKVYVLSAQAITAAANPPKWMTLFYLFYIKLNFELVHVVTANRQSM